MAKITIVDTETEEDARIGARVKAHRHIRGLSRADIARATGLDAATLLAIEAGAPLTAPRLRAVAAALDVAVEDLLDPPGGAVPQAAAEAALAHDYLLATADPRLRRAALAMLAALAGG